MEFSGRALPLCARGGCLIGNAALTGREVGKGQRKVGKIAFVLTLAIPVCCPDWSSGQNHGNLHQKDGSHPKCSPVCSTLRTAGRDKTAEIQVSTSLKGSRQGRLALEPFSWHTVEICCCTNRDSIQAASPCYCQTLSLKRKKKRKNQSKLGLGKRGVKENSMCVTSGFIARLAL